MAPRLGGLALAAVLLVAVAILLFGPREAAVSRSSDGESALLQAHLDSLPQDGISLGRSDAPVTMVEFADLQCPFCADYHARVLPELLDRYVQTGRLRLELRVLRFLGPDSDRLARLAAGAAPSDRMWQVAALAYQRQGAENSGYADDDFLGELAADAGLDRIDTGATAERTIAAAEHEAHHARIASTPSFLLGPTGGRLRRFEPTALDPAEFAQRIGQELSR